MRHASVATEAWRNIRTGTTRAWVLAFVLAAGLAGLAALDILTVARLQRDALTFDHSGASTRRVAAEGLINGADCDRLGELKGVRGAGAVKPSSPITLVAVPGDPIPSYAVSPGLSRVLGVQGAPGTGVWVPTSLAQLLGVGEGSVLATRNGPMRVAGTFAHPDDGRDARFGFAVLVPQPATAPFDECWATSWPSVAGLDDALRWTGKVVPDSTTPLTIGQFNNSHGPSYDPGEALDARVTRWGWLGAVVIGLALGYAASRRRRLEYASALHAGQSRSAQVLTAMWESTVWVAVGVVVAGLAAAVAAWRVVPEDQVVVMTGSIPALVAGGVSAVVGAVIGVAQTKERHLFGYFKDR